ncbi:acyltransferase [Lacisediminihabitans changchengi]|uniref:Acyltransferase n=1 Tax=Lacisediminihabitans changchengi TaxID=2787634 RepID=A0A934SP10_9MICO|nr:acyltransferase [Lacisediminihabitans changchengi]MBK4346448.1 acyltransferase [Lacisediminihabitans changchengi]MBK4348924.1 acyltransferase [Lacisediminihabitans changchengi]
MKQGFKIVFLSVFGRWPIHFIRIATLRAAGVTIERDVVIYHGYQVRNPRGLFIGEDSSIGEKAVLDARGGLRIGRSVNVSSEVQIWSAQHDWKSESFEYVESSVVVGDRVWIGPRVTVLPGSVIEDGVVIAAGAVVRGHLDAWSLYAGVPAKKIGDRPHNMGYRLGGPTKKLWLW